MSEKICFLCEESIESNQSRIMHTECRQVHRKCEDAHRKGKGQVKLSVSKSASAKGYAPFKPPFKYDADGQCIFDSAGNMIVDVRGWGFLTGKGAKAYKQEKAMNIQDGIGRRIAQIMNEDVGA